ncbi:baculoviral IAP repeat-containing protein 7-B-like [Mya arenaria]|uniref:baculoviral IAP repeat-containing protein 7-B-like n=1 Tax=Mya arenaria TaxID=6604 RepID=UPI0022E26EA9|nr:baculoviral IAP repeat-containing protein 7-B-like [Mya arenaria]
MTSFSQLSVVEHRGVKDLTEDDENVLSVRQSRKKNKGKSPERTGHLEGQSTEEQIAELRGNMGIILDVRATCPGYAQKESRLKSFKKMRERNGHSVDILATTGLYRTKDGSTKCFHCGVFINVPEGADPWGYHITNSPFCAHMRMCKGDMFITKVLKSGTDIAKEDIPISFRKSSSKHRTCSPDFTEALEENQRLKENMLCKICFDDIACIIVLSCGHMASCSQCISALRNCPICRSEVKGTVRATLVPSGA